MDVRFLLIVTLAITVYIVLGGLLFQFIERRPPEIDRKNGRADDQNGSNVIFLEPIPLDVEMLHETARLLLSETLKKTLSLKADGFSLNLTIHDGVHASVTSKNDSTAILASNNRTRRFLQASIILQRNDRWETYSAIFYAITLVTSIGYGHVAPLTTAGRLCSSFYSVIGIPLLGVWLVAIGESMLELATVVRRRIHIKKKHQRKVFTAQALIVLTLGSLIFIFCPAAFISKMEDWPYSDGIYYSVITLATIGLGDIVAGFKDGTPIWYRVLLNLWLFFGLGWLSTMISLSVRIFRTKATKVVKQAGDKMAQTLKEKFVSRQVKLVRRQSFSGKREISVMLSRTSSHADIMDLATGHSRYVRLEPPTSTDRRFERSQSLVHPPTNLLATGRTHRQHPRDNDKFVHDVLRLSSICENDPSQLFPSFPMKRSATFDHPLTAFPRPAAFTIGDKLIVETSRGRPSLGAKSASVLLFDTTKNNKDQASKRDAFSRLEPNLEPNSPTESISSHGIVINIVPPDDDSKFGEEQNEPHRHPLSASHWQLPRPSARLHIGDGHHHQAALSTSNEQGTRLDSLVVITDNGIAESFCEQITILRPRSKTVDC